MTNHYHHHPTASTLRRRTTTISSLSSPRTFTGHPVSDTHASTLNNTHSTSKPSTEAVAGTNSKKLIMAVMGLLRLPCEILVGDILAILRLADLACVTRVCKAMHQLCEADYLWQRKFFIDYAFRPSKTLRQLGGWKRMYQAMDRVEVYTWGSNSDCRLGYGRTSRKHYESVPKRIRRLDGVGIVQLAPTGWGCHALDKEGNVWAWGRIMESNGIRSDAMPRMLKRPRNVVQLTAGRQVVLAMDANGQVWQWCRENKAVEVTFAAARETSNAVSGNVVNNSNTSNKGSNLANNLWDPIVQISAGWEICAALTRSGRLFAWRPPQSADGRYQHRIHVEYSVGLKEQGYQGYEASLRDGDKFAQIAAGTDYVVTVTALERVFIFRRLDSPHYRDPGTIPQYQQQQHTYYQIRHISLGHFFLNTPTQPTQEQREDAARDRIVIETVVEGSSQERVVEIRGKLLGEGLFLPIFSEALMHAVTATYEEHEQWERRQRHHRHCGTTTATSTAIPSACCDSPEELFCTRSSSSRPITLSANFENFAIHHCSGKVLLGKDDVQQDACPMVIERLYSDACQVAFGDHHQGLLTEDGQLRTWGSFSEGALGQGDLKNGCVTPTAIEGPLKNKIVIAIGFAGWQSSCLAIDMSEDRSSYSTYGSSNSNASHYGVGKGKKLPVDDGYYSLENASTSGSGSGSSSEGFDSSDGEDLIDNSINNDHQTDRSPLSSPLSVPATLTSPWVFPSSVYLPLSSACTASCSLLVSPHSHRLGSGAGSHSRPTPLRKRSSSLIERRMPEEGQAHRGHHGASGGSSGSNSSNTREARMVAVTRLSPIFTIYESSASSEIDVMPGRFSML